MNIYYIDYENVTSQGLKGIELLTEEDEVNLLYSKKAETMKIDMLTQLMASRANIRFLPVHVGTPNALDFQLITLLFLHYTEGNRYFIISKDSGYDCCIKTAIENNAPNVFRFPNIESAVNGGQKQRSQRSRRGSGRNSQNHSQTAAVPIQAQEQNMVQEQDLNAAQEQDMAQEQDLNAAQEQDPYVAQEQDLYVAQEQDLNAAYMQEADVMQPQSTDSAKDAGAMPNHDPITAQTQKADNAQSQDLNDLDVQAADNAPVQSQDVEDDHDEAADEGHASSEDSGRKRNSRRRGRRKSSSASQTEAASAEKAADARNDVAEENHEEPGQTKANRSQKQSRQTKDNQKQAKDSPKQAKDIQKQAQQGRDNQNQRQPQQNRDNQSQKPVTILSVIRRRNDVQLDLSQIDLIRDALKNTSNKQQFYNFFAKKLGQKKGIELYHSIKSSYTDLINANLV